MSQSTRTCHCFAVLQTQTPLVPFEYQSPPLESSQVEVKVLYCGVCSSDIDIVAGAYDAFGMYPYPIVPGHEGVGVVTELGLDVKHLKIGQRVGLGVYRDSCNSCKFCVGGQSNLCSKKVLMFVGTNKGCFSDYVRINARFAIPIPDEIPTEKAGPLLCAGVTTFAPFRLHNIKPGDHVGIVGIGGLGHLAIKIANKWGCRVTALSRGVEKKNEAVALGAHHYIDTTAPMPAQLQSPIDFLFLTASGPQVDYNGLIDLLESNGKLIVLGMTGITPVPISMMGLIMGQKSICGGASGSLSDAIEMLSFCGLHSIFPETETFPIEQCNEVMKLVKASQVKHRAVLKISKD